MVIKDSNNSNNNNQLWRVHIVWIELGWIFGRKKTTFSLPTELGKFYNISHHNWMIIIDLNFPIRFLISVSIFIYSYLQEGKFQAADIPLFDSTCWGRFIYFKSIWVTLLLSPVSSWYLWYAFDEGYFWNQSTNFKKCQN